MASKGISLGATRTDKRGAAPDQLTPMQDRLVRFHLFGQEYTFFSDAPEDEVEEIINLLQRELDTGERMSRSAMPSSKMLILGCLRMTAKFVQLSREYRESRRSQQQVVERLIERITAELE